MRNSIGPYIRRVESGFASSFPWPKNKLSGLAELLGMFFPSEKTKEKCLFRKACERGIFAANLNAHTIYIYGTSFSWSWSKNILLALKRINCGNCLCARHSMIKGFFFGLGLKGKG